DGAGSIYLAAGPGVLPVLRGAASELGLTFTGIESPPSGGALRLRPVRVGLWDRYGGSSPSGWTRWMVGRYEFPFEVVYAQALDAGSLADRFDVILLPSDAVPSSKGAAGNEAASDLPPEYAGTTGSMTWDRTVPQLERFVRDGGTLMLIGGST